IVSGGQASRRIAADGLAARARIRSAHLDLSAQDGKILVELESLLPAAEGGADLETGQWQANLEPGFGPGWCGHGGWGAQSAAHSGTPAGVLLPGVDAREEMALADHR